MAQQVAVEFNPVDSLTRDFLQWLDQRPRTYADVMEAWRTSCPRLAIWEDANAAGLVRIESKPGTPLSRTQVSLTENGRALLNGNLANAVRLPNAAD